MNERVVNVGASKVRMGEGRSHSSLGFALAEAIHVKLPDEGSKLTMSKEGW